MIQALVLSPQRLVADVPRRDEHGRLLDQRERHALVATYRTTEGLPRSRVLQCVVEGRLGDADAHQADHRPRVVEALHHRDESGALLPDQLVATHRHPIEMQRRTSDGSAAVVIERGSRDPLVVEVDVERADPARPGPSGAREDHTGVGRHPQ